MQNVDISAMDIDDSTPRKKDDLLAMAVVQDLDPFSVTELRERVVLLESEIANPITSLLAFHETRIFRS